MLIVTSVSKNHARSPYVNSRNYSDLSYAIEAIIKVGR